VNPIIRRTALGSKAQIPATSAEDEKHMSQEPDYTTNRPWKQDANPGNVHEEPEAHEYGGFHEPPLEARSKSRQRPWKEYGKFLKPRRLDARIWQGVTQV
jgi:hypothetical protein